MLDQVMCKLELAGQAPKRHGALKDFFPFSAGQVNGLPRKTKFKGGGKSWNTAKAENVGGEKGSIALYTRLPPLPFSCSKIWR